MSIGNSRHIVAVAFAVLAVGLTPASASAQTPPPAPAAPQASSPAPSAAQLLELIKTALDQGRTADAEKLLSQALATVRRDRMIAQGEMPVAAMYSRAVRVGGDISEPRKIRDVKPWYPSIAQAANVQGIVIIEALIDTEGNVADARVIRSVALLDQAALDAVQQWRFTPTVLNNVPVPVVMTVTVNFTLGGQ